MEKTSETRVKIALQKNGRLADESLQLLEKCGLHITRSKDQLFCRIKELPIDLLLLRDDDIPSLVSRGVCDLGIVGENVYAETQAQKERFQAQIIERLGFSRCRLSIAVPENLNYRDVADLSGLMIATSYPYLLGAFLEKASISSETLVLQGAVEIAPRIKIADAICDIVASGATLSANGLKEVAVILESEALLIKSGEVLGPEKNAIIARLVARIRGALQAEDSKYIMLHADKNNIDEIVRYLPGAEAPTILPLNGSADKYAVHAVCREAVFWETMEQLQGAGASAILVLPIEKMMAR